METTNVASLQQHLIIKYIFSYHTAFAKHHLIYDVPDQNGCRNGAELAEPADGSTQLPWGSVLSILIEITITHDKYDKFYSHDVFLYVL